MKIYNGGHDQGNDIISLIVQKKIEENINNPSPNLLGIDKDELWRIFSREFFKLHKHEFLWGDKKSKVIQNLKVIFDYFLRDPSFFDSESIRGDLSVPSFEKGLMIFGGYGVGKTSIMQTFELIFKDFIPFRFKVISTNNVVMQYESCRTPEDKEYFFKSMTSGIRLFDDFTAENVASNFGYNDIMRSIIEKRYNKKILTHFTLNYAVGLEGDVGATLLEINQRYTGRVYERLIEMCNIVEFKGKSLRR